MQENSEQLLREHKMIENINTQVNESLESRVRALSGYIECLQKISFINLDLIRRNMQHWKNFINASLENDKRILVNGYDLLDNVAKELRTGAEESRQALTEFGTVANYIKGEQVTKAKGSLAEIDALYANTVNYWKDNLASFAGSAN